MGNRKRQSILCPNCRKLISLDETRCPYCGVGRPGSWWKNSIWAWSYGEPEGVVRAIIVVTAIMYGISVFLYPRGFSLTFNPFSLFSPDSRSLVLLGATGTLPIDLFHGWWTLISANYLHGSLLHILFNMLALRYLGTLVGQEYGTYRMLVLYTLGGALGFFVSYLAGVRLTIGASAALSSLMGAALYYGKSRGGAYGQAVYRQVGGWAIGLFLIGILMPGINNWAHAGGGGAGLGLAYLLGYREKKPERLIDRVLAALCVTVTVLILGWLVVSAFLSRLLT